MKKQVVNIYTDGACKGNPGPGGWGAWLTYGKHEKEIFGGERNTTNNRMELIAVIESLNALKRSCEIILTVDSKYVMDGATKWMHNWKKKGWEKGNPKIKNLDLWKQLDECIQLHDITWKWVKGHSGHPGNEKADKLANRGMYSTKN